MQGRVLQSLQGVNKRIDLRERRAGRRDLSRTGWRPLIAELAPKYLADNSVEDFIARLHSSDRGSEPTRRPPHPFGPSVDGPELRRGSCQALVRLGYHSIFTVPDCPGLSVTESSWSPKKRFSTFTA